MTSKYINKRHSDNSLEAKKTMVRKRETKTKLNKRVGSGKLMVDNSNI